MSIELIPLGPRLGIKSPFSQAVVSACKSIPGMKWAPADRLWVGYPDAVEAALRLLPGKVRWEIPSVKKDHATPTNWDGLRLYQNVGVGWLRANSVGILADDMGLGKSAQVLIAAAMAGRKTIIVCPAYVKSVWLGPEGQIARWWPGAKVYECSGRDSRPVDADDLLTQGNDVVVVNYDILGGWVKLLKAWGGGGHTLIFDEAAALTGNTSKRTKAARELRAGASRCWAMTGTPMPNYVKDLWPILETLCPGRFGTFHQFGVRYCDAHQEMIPAIQETHWKYEGKSHEEELSSRLHHLMLRRTKDDVSLELPTKIRKVTWLDARAKRLAPGPRRVDAILDALGAAKVPAAIETAARYAAQGLRVVIGCRRVAIADAVAEGLRGAGLDQVELVTGSVPAARRAERISRAKVLVVTIDSCATGVDFSWASVAVIAELLYEPHKMLQFESRFHRPGSRGIVLEYLAVRGSVDEIIASRIVSKLDAWEKVLGKGATSEAGIANDLGGLPSEEDILREIMAVGA